jgi:hypothetical protein
MRLESKAVIEGAAYRFECGEDSRARCEDRGKLKIEDTGTMLPA